MRRMTIRSLLVLAAAVLAVAFLQVPTARGAGDHGAGGDAQGDAHGGAAAAADTGGTVTITNSAGHVHTFQKNTFLWVVQTGGKFTGGLKPMVMVTENGQAAAAATVTEGPSGVYRVVHEPHAAGAMTVDFSVSVGGTTYTDQISATAAAPHGEVEEDPGVVGSEELRVEFYASAGHADEGETVTFNVYVMHHDANPITGLREPKKGLANVKLLVQEQVKGDGTAVTVVSLAEGADGVYAGTVTFAEHGKYDLAFWYDKDGDGNLDDGEWDEGFVQTFEVHDD